MSELIELAEFCEKVPGPDRALDAQIGRYFAADFLGYVPDEAATGCAKFTASLDAALTLVPEGWATVLRETTQGDQNSYTGDEWLPNWNAGLIEHKTSGYKQREHWAHGTGASPALALCAAALRARSTPNPGDSHGG